MESYEILEDLRLIPRGREWNRRSLVRPDNAVPWNRNGFATCNASVYTPLLTDTVRNNINGLRIERLVIGTSISFQPTAGTGWVWKKDGVPYDETWTLFMMPSFQATPIYIPVFLVFEAGQALEFGLQNSVSALNGSLYAYGWEF